MNLERYSEPTQRYISDVIAFLTEKYNGVPAEWEAIIYLLGDNLDLYNQCKEAIETYGIYDATTGKKNGLLITIKDLQATIMKQIQHLGLSPYAISKIKEDDNDDTDEFIEKLTNGE